MTRPDTGPSGAARRTPPSLAPSYDVVRELGRGGMATVYLARETKHGRQVAVKVLDRDDLAESGTSRFLFEIHLTARLSHPHIVPLLDSGSVDGRPYYVMPFVDGGTLRVRTQRGPLDAAEALKLAGEIADALAYAHAQGVLHRDVKPENIILSGRSAVVTDFGLARALEAVGAHETRTDLSIAVGTPAYMSPEQAAGEVDVDERSDVYSLGAVIYEMLTGDAPFTGDTPLAVISARFTEPPPSPRARRAELHESVDALVRRAMAFEPADRYASAAEFGDAIERVARAADDQDDASPMIAREVPSVAILPFENTTGDADDEFLASGITDEVLTSLARGGAMRVAGRGSTFALAGSAVDARAICERLGVRAVLMGSVRRAGKRLRVSAQLVNGADGFQLWAERYDRTMDDLFDVQDEIAQSITAALRGTLLSSTAEARTRGALSPADPEAYSRYLRACHSLNKRTVHDMQSAREWFGRAIHLDGRFAAAHAGLADAWALLGVYGAVAPHECFVHARRAAESALEIDPTLAAAHAVLGVIQAGYEWNFAQAEASFSASLSITPTATAYQWLATMVLLPQSRFDEAFVAVRRALRLDPLSLSARSTLTVALVYSRRYDEAVHAAREALDLEPRFALAHFFQAQALSALGDLAGAVAAAERACEFSGRSSECVAFAAYAYGQAGDTVRAAELGRELRTRAAEQYVSASHLALAALGIGDVEEALGLLARAVETRATELIWLGVRPAWDSLRESPRFREIVRRALAI